MKKKPKETLPSLPRRGGEETAIFHSRKAGVMLDKRTRRLRTRTARSQRLISEGLE